MKNNFKARLLSLSLAVSMLSPMGVATTAFADGVASTVFSNDFESYNTNYEWLTVYDDYSDTSKSNVSYVMKYATGCGSMSAKFLKPGETTPYTEGMYTTDTDGITRPKTGKLTDTNGYYYTNMKPEITGEESDKFVAGGLGDGYYGLNHKWGFPRIAGGNWEEANVRENGYDLCVVKDGENQVFRLSPSTAGSQGTNSQYSMFGKGGQQFAGKINLVKTDVKIAADTSADAFRLCITKDDKYIEQKSQQYYGWMNNGTQFWYKSGASMYDAVMFKSGKIYLGPDFGKSNAMSEDAYICDYKVGTNYTVEYYLDLTNLASPSHMVRIFDGTTLVGEKSANIALTEKTNTTVNNSDFYTELTADIPGQRPTGDYKFSQFTDSTSYGVCMIETTAFDKSWMRGGAVALIDNFSLETVTAVPEKGFRFSNDFEEYNDPFEWATVWTFADTSKKNQTHFLKENNRSASSIHKMLKTTETNPLDDDKSEIVEGYPRLTATSGIENVNSTQNNWYYKAYDAAVGKSNYNGKFVAGGMEGYYGFSAFNARPVITGYGSDDGKDAFTADLFVITEDDNNNALKLAPKDMGDGGRTNQWSVFGKSGFAFKNTLNKISCDVKVTAETDNSQGFRISITKDDVLNDVKSWNDYGFMTWNRQFTQNKGVKMYDAVLFLNGNVYLGPDFGTINNITAPVICSYKTGTNYTVEYYLDLTGATPKHTVIVKDGDKIVGKKESDLNLTANTNTTLMSKAFDDRANDAGPIATLTTDTNTKYFTEFDDDNDYGIMLSTANYAKNGLNVLVDNFSYYVVDNIKTHGMGISSSIGTDGKTVTATLIPATDGSAEFSATANVFAAEYDSATGKLLQFAKGTDAITATDLTEDIVFANEFTKGSKIKLFLWNSLSGMEPVTGAVNVR